MKSVALLIFALTLVPFAHAEEIRGKVVGVADGDTVTILDDSKTQHKIRINGIDAPEKGQAFGNRAKEAMSDLVFSKTVSAYCGKVDRYQRQICVVRVAGKDVGLELIRQGLAWHFKRYEKDQLPGDRVTYAEAEELARKNRVGLWADKEPMPPWDWRKR